MRLLLLYSFAVLFLVSCYAFEENHDDALPFKIGTTLNKEILYRAHKIDFTSDKELILSCRFSDLQGHYLLLFDDDDKLKNIAFTFEPIDTIIENTIKVRYPIRWSDAYIERREETNHYIGRYRIKYFGTIYSHISWDYSDTSFPLDSIKYDNISKNTFLHFRTIIKNDNEKGYLNRVYKGYNIEYSFPQIDTVKTNSLRFLFRHSPLTSKGSSFTSTIFNETVYPIRRFTTWDKQIIDEYLTTIISNDSYK